MCITELLKTESIELDTKVSSKEEAIDQLVSLMDAGGRLKDKAGYKEGTLAREGLGSTATGGGIAILHARMGAVGTPGLAATVVPEGVDYDAFDDPLAHLLLMIVAPAGGADVHLEASSRLSTLLVNPGFKERLIAAEFKEEFLQIIDEAEVARSGVPEGAEVSEGGKKGTEESGGVKDGASEGANAGAPASGNTGSVKAEIKGHRVLAVTVYPAGIAHTYIAVENLENTGKKLGIPLKAETDGSGGAQNVLTREEITEADAIIIAADKNVETAWLDGRSVIMVPVADGIHKAEDLVKRVVSGTVPVYYHTGAAGSTGIEDGNDSLGRTVYKYLVSGVSHMFSFVIGGGILIALAFLLDDYSIDPLNFGKNTPLAVRLKTIGEQAFGMMLPILAGPIAMSIVDCPGLAVGLVAGMIAEIGSTFANSMGGDANAGFLGALSTDFVGGCIVVGLRKLFSRPPKSLEGIRPVLLYPVTGIFLAAMVTTFINLYTGMTNDGLIRFLGSMGGASGIVLGMVLGGMMSIDTDDPFNKAVYVFGTAQLAEGNFEVMATVTAGGMVPPITIALCTIFFKERFTDRERQSGIVNYVMGLSFIIEGVIPSTAQDPLRVVPSCIIGSALADGLSMAFGCTLRTPHGGILVLPIIGNSFMYLAAVVVGVAVGCVILGFPKKNVRQ